MMTRKKWQLPAHIKEGVRKTKKNKKQVENQEGWEYNNESL